jgi:xanthine/uracil permease
LAEPDFLYRLDEKPPLLKSVVYGLQWMMVAIPNVVVFSALCSAALGLDPAGQISFSQRLLIVTGLMTLLQSLGGHRYPVLEAPSSALLLSFIVLAPYGLPAIEGGLIAGGLLLIVVGGLKGFKRLSPLFTPNVVGSILMLVALTLLPFAYPLLVGMSKARPHGEVAICGISLLIILFVSLLSHWVRGFVQTTSMLAGILFGLILFLLRGDVSFDMVLEASWLALPSPLPGGWPAFSLPAVFSMVFTYMAVLVNTVGSIQGMGGIVGKGSLDDRLNRGIGMTGAGGLVAAGLGVVGLVSASMSSGVVLVSRVASRHVLAVSGILMIACAFIPKLWALLAAIPPSVTAAVLFVALSSQLMAGISVMMSGKKEIERREYFTVGLSLLLGTTVAILPRPFFQLFPAVLAPLVGNGLVMGILASLILEHVLFRPRGRRAP